MADEVKRPSTGAPIDDGQFIDETFPPSPPSVHGPGAAGGGHKADASELPTPHSWVRFSELWPLETLPPATPALIVQQGPYLGDCWLLSPLTALAARHPSKLRELFSACTAEDAAAGKVCVRLCPHGWWREVEVDTLLPCDDKGRPLFAGTVGAGWAAIVEKAFAKMLGSYAALEGGRCVEALVDLTSGVCQQHKIEEGTEAIVALGANLRKWHDQKHLLCCTRRGREKGEDDAAPHVPSNHAYALVDVRKQEAVLLRDPAAVRSEEEGEEDERYAAPSFSADTWVPMEQFAKLFDKLIMCKAFPREKPVPGLKPTKSDVEGLEETPPAPGGVEGTCWLQHTLRIPRRDLEQCALPTSPTWCQNPQWALTCKAKSQMIIALGQRRRRERRVLGLSIARGSSGGGSERAWTAEPEHMAAEAGPALAREVVARFTAAPGGLVLVPWQYADRSLGATVTVGGDGDGGGDDDDDDDGGGFTIRVWCDAPCTLSRLPSLLRVEATGRWDVHLSATGGVPAEAAPRTDGGRWPLVSWALNPQFALCAAADGHAMLILERVAANEGEQGVSATASASVPFDAANAIGVRVVYAPAVSAEPPGGAVHVASGISGNVRDAAGGLLPDQVHHSLTRSESDLDAFGIRGKQPPLPKPGTAGGGVLAGGGESAHDEGGLASAAAAAATVARTIVSDAASLVSELGYTNEHEASSVLRLSAGTPLLAVPSLATAGRTGRFRLSLYADVAVALHRVSRGAHAAHIDGEWKKGSKAATTAGGCHLEPTWGKNPQYALTVGGGGAASLRVVLRRPEAPWEKPMQSATVDSMMGFYLLRAPPGGVDGGQKLKLSDKARATGAMVHESCFAPTLEVSCTVQLGAPEPTTLVLVPATYGPGQQGPFEVALACDEPLSWVQLA